MTSPSTIPAKFLSKADELGVVAVGFSGGQCKPGVDAAPQALVSAGILTQLKSDLGYKIHHDDCVHTYDSLRPASDPDIRGMKNPRAVSAVTHRIADQVYTQAREGRCVLTLGGDHSIAIGTIAGTSRAVRERVAKGDLQGDGEIGVIWVDAHADINSPETSGSGNIHGMPLSFLTGLAQKEKAAEKTKDGDEDVFGWLDHMDEQNGIRSQAETPAGINGGNHHSSKSGKPALNLKKLVYIGLRDVDRGEKEILRREGIKAFSMHDIDRHGIGRILDLSLAYLGENTPIHLSFDVDALDPQWAPSTGTPVRGGLTLREGDFIAEGVHQTGQLIAMDLVEVNPRLGDAVRSNGVINGDSHNTNAAGGEAAAAAEDTLRAGVSLVRCALGDTLL